MIAGWAPALCAFWLAGCAACPCPDPGVARVPPALLPALTACAGPTAVPKPPPAPRSVEQLAVWAVATEAARASTEAARADCAARLRTLHDYLADRPK